MNGKSIPQAILRGGILALLMAAAVVRGQPVTEFVPGADLQPGGPTYDFRVGRFEVTNDEFAAFLNSALDNLGHPRGQWLFFESDTGDVYINDDLVGVVAPAHDPQTVSTLIFSPSEGGDISYGGSGYVVASGRGDHPVVGVTWYGAIKYCNWLTLEAGFGVTQQVYTESTADAGWHPIGIDTVDWESRGLNDAEREALLGLWGFRLPMDGGGVDNGAGDPSAYNEWYKAGSARANGASDPVFDSDYGFGRGAIVAADANYCGSEDPFEDPGACANGGTTPVGFYDGTNLLADGPPATQTVDTQNAYGLYDVSGNVWEWMQDQASDFANRRVRGGAFRSVTNSLKVTESGERFTHAVDNAVGFRVVQSVPTPLFVLPEKGFVSAGPWGGPYDEGDTFTYTVTNATVADVGYLVEADADWVTLSSEPPCLVGPCAIGGGASIVITVTIAPECALPVPVGLQESRVRFINTDDGSVIERTVKVAFEEPLTLTPSANLSASIVHGDSLPSFTLTLENESEAEVPWSIRAMDLIADPPGQLADWLLIDGVPSQGSGALPLPGGESSTSISIGFDIDFSVAAPHVGTFSAALELTDDCTGTVMVRTVTLTVQPLFSVTPVDVVAFTGVVGGPFLPVGHEFALTNLVDAPGEWHVEVVPFSDPPEPPNLLDVDPPTGSLPPLNQEASIFLSASSLADALETGSYFLVARFISGTFVLERPVRLDVSELLLNPIGEAMFSGPSAGPFVPADVTYRLTNSGSEDMEWVAELVEDCNAVDRVAVDWADVSPLGGVILNPMGTADLTVALLNAAQILSPNTYNAQLCVATIDPNDPTGPPLASATREVSLRVGAAAFSLEMVDVPIEPAPPAGPDHRYRMSKFEVTCAQFVQFLNDAQREGNGADARGAFMGFDAATGDVTLLGSGEAMVVTANSNAASPILYDPMQAPGLRYTVAEGFGNHPVTFVSWYGAVKYANWLTAVQGMGGQEVYAEGPAAADWGAILDPATGLLDRRGFRLPMDDAALGASLFNEWYKVASARLAGENDVQFDAGYGFGRDVLEPLDANFLNSGDPFEGGSGDPFSASTTPIGFFTGTIYNFNGAQGVGNGVEFSTRINENAFGVADLTGNVAEWVHERDASVAYVRGGHLLNGIGSGFLTNESRAAFDPATTASVIGFRVVQALPDELTALAAEESGGLVKIAGLIGGPQTVVGGSVGQTALSWSLTNPGDYTIDNVVLSLAPAGNRLRVVGEAPTLVPPGPPQGGANVVVSLESAATPTDPGASEAPNGDFALVSGDDLQPGGPDYDYWIARKEVTNDEYAAFLNSARSSIDPEHLDPLSDYLYFDLISGSVFVGSTQAGALGLGLPPGRDVLIYDMSVGRIGLSGETYIAESGFGDHPVVGVSWYGAVKYCNWRSRIEGVPESLLAYGEGSNFSLISWRPVTATQLEWSTTGMSAGSRAKLAANTLGYRLPMDGEASQAAPFNEWVKAAAWNPTTQITSVYGFGRDTLTDADANFLDSGDTEENGTTPVGHFNGISSLFALPLSCPSMAADPVLTAKSENGYGLADATGNVAEWMQDFGTGAGDRAVRGGSWRSGGVGAAALTTTERVVLPPDTVADDVGFRLVRGTGHVVSVSARDGVSGETTTDHFLLDVREPLRVRPRGGISESVPYPAAVDLLHEGYTIWNRSVTAMDWRVSSSVDWIDVKDVGGAEPPGSEASGSVAAAGAVGIEVTTNASVRTLRPGEHVAVVLLKNLTTGGSETRTVRLNIAQPIEARTVANQSAPHVFTGPWGGPFATMYGDGTEHTERTFELANLLVDASLDYSVTENASWLTVTPTAVNPPVFLSGTLDAGDVLSFEMAVDASAGQFPVGTVEESITLTFVDPANGNLSDSVRVPVTLQVRDPLGIVETCAACGTCGTWAIQPGDGESALAGLCDQVFTLSNDLVGTGAILEISITVDAPWVDLSMASVELLPDQPAGSVFASINAEALALGNGTYEATVTFTDALTGASQCRKIALSVAETLAVTPYSTYRPTAALGALASPPFRAYTVFNVDDGAGAIDWAACSSAAWLTLTGGTVCDAAAVCDVGGVSAVCGALADGEAVQVVASVDAAVTSTMAAGIHTATVNLQDLTSAVNMTRAIEVTLLDPQLDLNFVAIESSIAQPQGPRYVFDMAPRPVTNGQFVKFLNDARSDLGGLKGQYLYFDSDTGDVYVNPSMIGEIGVDVVDRVAKVFSVSDSERIQYSAATGVYSVATAPTDFTSHPVAGVSWYGAVKFCNWLTLDQGLPAGERCYAEGPESDLAAWRPVTISSAVWATRDLNDAERDTLVRGFRGYRLPMDDGVNNVSSGTDSADDYNEWYLASAWDPITLVNHDYGVGVDDPGELTNAHANFKCSGDPFEDAADCTAGSTTPAGFYDGVNVLTDGTPTIDTANGFGLYDMSGNVWEWVQDRFNTNAGSLAQRAIRGGSFRFLPPLLRTDFRTWAPTSSTMSDIGFRVVRVVTVMGGDFDADADVDWLDLQSIPFCMSGPDALGPLPTGCAVFDLQTGTGGVDVDLADFAVFQNLFTGPM